MQETITNKKDDAAKKIGLITGISNEIYFCTISRLSTVYVELVDDNWMAWRESYAPNSNKMKSHKVLAIGSFELAIARTKNYLKFMKQFNN
ncbi:pathogenicity island protein [Macrococcoides goetzii]|nr:pathogenicity island protein [Macrococcus goetzii]TDM48287.1 pathogenicity island protein [Macrococcus goetzii]